MRAATIMLVAVLLASSCAGGNMMTTKPAGERKRDEILQLDGQILEWREKAKLNANGPSKFLLDDFLLHPEKRIDPLVDKVPEICFDVCDIGERICHAKDDICRLADELGEDDWARRKCASAKASCSEARSKCDSCAKKHGADANP